MKEALPFNLTDFPFNFYEGLYTETILSMSTRDLIVSGCAKSLRLATYLTNHEYLFHFLIFATLFIVGWYMLFWLFSPLRINKSLKDVGWNFLAKEKLKSSSLTEAISQVQRLRKVGNLPPVFPNGWFALEESRNLSKGEVKSVMALGESLALFRNEKGEVRILDAYCPHLGANMAVGGLVKGDCLECPFHGWQFDGTNGKCTTIPYVAKVPESAKVRKWESREVNGVIFVWYDADDRPPQYEVPIIDEVNGGSWSHKAYTQHEVLAHIQEIPENGADLAHLAHIHVPNILKGTDLSTIFNSKKIYDIVQHHWEGKWAPLEGSQSHAAQMQLTHSFSFLGGLFHLFGMDVNIKQIGPSLVHLHFETIFGKGALIQTVTPVEPLKQLLTHRFYSSSFFVTPIAKILMLMEASHVERDIMVWNNKQFLSQPFLTKEDKLISKYRRWYSQFYSENSPTIRTYKKESLDW